MPVIATCPHCGREYPFDFPGVGKTKREWTLLESAKVSFISSCPHCHGRFRANMKDFLVWKD
jgi:phage terminase large subunit GpA-like protein